MGLIVCSCRLGEAIRLMMLPDDVSLGQKGDTNAALMGAQAILQKLTAGKESSYSTSIQDPVDKTVVNRALAVLVGGGDAPSSEKMLDALASSNIPLRQSVLGEALRLLNRSGKFEKTIQIFDNLEELYNIPHPNPFVWASLIEAKAITDVDEAVRTIGRLEKSGMTINANMLNPVLRGLMKAKRHDEVFNVWVDMKWKGIVPNRESYDIMIEQCEYRSQPERAFFLVDEMKELSIAPAHSTYVHLFRACAAAPHWVHGYHDIIFDAMCYMEGQELLPTKEVYNSVIFAFARAGDAAAALFYLREMQKKKLVPDETSYNYTLMAFANAQMVGAKAYGMLGRWARQPDPPDTPTQRLYKKVGFHKVNEQC
jgi:pentatricopeptide repeat protein